MQDNVEKHWINPKPGVSISFHLDQYSSVQFSHLVVSSFLWPHGLQHVRPPCSSPTPGVYPNSCSLSWWCHPTISFSVVLFSCPQSYPASGSFQMSQLFASGAQSIGVSASTSVLSMNVQNWFPLGGTGWISLQSEGLSRVFSNTTVQKHQFFSARFFVVQLSHPYVTTGKTIALTRWTFVDKVMSLLFNMMSRLVITFFPRSKCLLISWLQSPSAVILESPKIKSATVSTVSPSICHEVMGPEVKSKGEKERYKHLNAEFQRIARRDKKAFLSNECKEIEENNRMGRLEISSRKLEIPREYFTQRWAR